MRSPTAIAACSIAAVSLLALSTHAAPQSQASSKARFEVASVKRNTSGSGGYSANPQPGGYNATNVPLPLIIQFAYVVDDYRLLGGPGWIQSTRFDIAARANRDVPLADVREMLQSLLQDRFMLVTHREQREMPVFALRLARSDGRLGPGLKRVDDNCARSNDAGKGPGDAPPGAVRWNACGPIAIVASMASRELGTPVRDQTGVTGTFDMFLYRSPEGSRQVGGVPRADSGAADPNLPSFPAALQEQLGLKLESGRGPVDVLVIDSVQQPTDN